MRSTQRFFANETLESFDAQGELSACEGSLCAETTRTQSFEIFRHQILRPIDDAQILRPATLHRRLSVSSKTAELNSED
jgi:hypothetical protein